MSGDNCFLDEPTTKFAKLALEMTMQSEVKFGRFLGQRSSALLLPGTGMFAKQPTETTLERWQPHEPHKPHEPQMRLRHFRCRVRGTTRFDLATYDTFPGLPYEELGEEMRPAEIGYLTEVLTLLISPKDHP